MARATFACMAVLFALGACRDGGGRASGAAASAASSASGRAALASGLKKGSQIVAATAPVSFRQGKVVALAGGEVTFAYGLPSRETGQRATAKAPLDRVWPTGSAADAEVGAHAICRLLKPRGKMPPLVTWSGCVVREKLPGAYRVALHDGSEHRLEPVAIIVPGAETQRAIAKYLADETKHRQFDDGFAKAGKPAVPDGWTAAAGDAVVAPFIGTSWYAGVVVSVDAAAKTARIRWPRKHWRQHDVAVDMLAPNPAPAHRVTVGSYAIVRPNSDEGRWDPARVTAVKGDAVTLQTRTGERREAQAADLIVFGG